MKKILMLLSASPLAISPIITVSCGNNGQNSQAKGDPYTSVENQVSTLNEVGAKSEVVTSISKYIASRLDTLVQTQSQPHKKEFRFSLMQTW